ncbi:nucleoside triphosphate pyrophosphohydrolase [Candidatus Sororendozoicomonas aggregata]|uniref:nucleoside triphosphate pyrophosphohydrolase n=1 Tax=Candidatus Sororendozoicomonas aggregata TaxID=3073239 RepID=UPI002ED1BA23
MTNVAALNDLLALMAILRDPDKGCPWDLDQTFSTIAPYTLEEACEVVEAIEQNDFENLREELGDLLFQVVFHARMAEESGLFDFSAVVTALVDKLLCRHPHVFPDGTLASAGARPTLTPEEVKARWEAVKSEQRQKKCPRHQRQSALPSQLPVSLPSLSKAMKVQEAAARVGFDWSEPEPVADKINEELAEIMAAAALDDQEALTEEVGDLLFACVNYARHLKVNPEMALRGAIRKFDRRFRAMEAEAARQSTALPLLTLAEMEALWQQVKRANTAETGH